MSTARWQVNRRPLDARRVVLMSSVGTRRTRTGFRRYRGTIQEGVVGSVRVASKAPLRAVVDVIGGQRCCEEVTMLSEVMVPKLGKRRYTTSLTRRELTTDLMDPKKHGGCGVSARIRDGPCLPCLSPLDEPHRSRARGGKVWGPRPKESLLASDCHWGLPTLSSNFADRLLKWPHHRHHHGHRLFFPVRSTLRPL